MTPLRHLAVIALSLLGCEATSGTGGTLVFGTGGGPRTEGGAVCSARLVVQSLRVRPGCTIDARVTQSPGLLQYPCAGGPASADFGPTRFAGAVTAGNVDVSIETRFHFTDGCDWSTKQEVTGALASGALLYRYTEGPLPGQARCAAACVATATVVLQVP